MQLKGMVHKIRTILKAKSCLRQNLVFYLPLPPPPPGARYKAVSSQASVSSVIYTTCLLN
jgi:hypothetical protein